MRQVFVSDLGNAYGGLGGTVMLPEMIAAGRLGPGPIFTETVPFDRIETAIGEFVARKPGPVEPLITVG